MSQFNSSPVSTMLELITGQPSSDYLFSYPAAFDMLFEFMLEIYKSSGKYGTKFDIRSKMNAIGVEYYVSPTGNDGNDGLSMAAPLKTIDTAIAKADAGTIILMEGDYYLTDNFTTQLIINKTINLIGRGNVRIFNNAKVTWAPHATYADVYQIVPKPTGLFKVISLDRYDAYGDESGLTYLATLGTGVAVTPYSWTDSGGNLYINLPATPTDSNVAVIVSTDIPVLITDSVGSTQIKAYIENVQFFGGSSPLKALTQTGQSDVNYTYANNCKFMHSGAEACFWGSGGRHYLVNCVAARSKVDGFAYTVSGTLKPYVIEIGCIGRNNGNVTSAIINNGSSMHDDGRIIRLNGDYFGNQGGNVADAYCRSLNINCKSHDSIISDATRAGNFVLIKGSAQADAKMWVIGCTSYGSVYDLISDGDANYDATIYTQDNQLLVGQNNLIGTGTIVAI